ncbi:MAG: hypothetical protein ACKVP7_07825 [Hyphomicrobiaceae bacterium]
MLVRLGYRMDQFALPFVLSIVLLRRCGPIEKSQEEQPYPHAPLRHASTPDLRRLNRALLAAFQARAALNPAKPSQST